MIREVKALRQPMGIRTKASKEFGENAPLKQVQPPSFVRKERKKVPVRKTMMLEQRLPPPTKSCVSIITGFASII
jgi:hypothetical protein